MSLLFSLQTDQLGHNRHNRQTGGGVCKTKKKVHKTVKNISNIIDEKLTSMYDSVVNTAENTVKKAKTRKNRALKGVTTRIKGVTDSYFKAPWRTSRPDLTLLLEVLLFILFMVILLRTMPKFTGSVKAPFTSQQLEKAMKIPSGQFSVSQLSEVNLEVQAFKDYRDYFNIDPFSLKNSGMVDLQRANALLPTLIFMIQYVVPPFVIAYVVWFILKYWKYVISALWGWFLMLYKYFTKLIQCKLGCKWYIRMVTGWRCCNPSFGTYFNEWRRKYVDRPIYYEKLKYLKQFRWVKRHYYEIPFRKYITLPYKRYKVKLEFAKKLYVDRAIEVMMKKLKSTYDPYVKRPKEELYNKVLTSNKNLAAIFTKAHQAKKQIEGKPYKSVTASGKVCTCPATKTPLNKLKKIVGKTGETVSHELKRLVKATDKVYDQVTDAVKDIKIDPTNCQTYDDLYENRRSVAGWLLGGMVATILGLFIYSQLFGTPQWLNWILTPATTYAARGLQILNSGQSYGNWIYAYVSMIGLFLTSIWLL